jgi:hypothetical protein
MCRYVYSRNRIKSQLLYQLSYAPYAVVFCALHAKSKHPRSARGLDPAFATAGRPFCARR